MPYLGCVRKMLVRKSDLRVNKDIMLGKLSKWLGRLSVGRKLMLIYLLDLTAVIYVSGILINEKFLSIDFARKEIAGVAYTEVVRHSLMSVFVPQGPNEAAAQASAVRLADIRRQHDEDLGTADMAEKFVQSLAKVNAHTGSAAGPAGQVWLRGGLLLDGRQLLTAVGNQSNLILDPDLDSYYVMSLSVLRFPELLQMLHDIQVFMLQPPGRSGSDHRTAELLTLAGRLDAVLWAMEADYNQAWVAGGPVLQRSLADSRQALQGQTRALLAALRDVAATHADGAPISWSRSEQAHAEVVQTLDVAWQASMQTLDGLLKRRVDGLFTRMWLHLGTALALLGCILSLVYLVASQIARPLRALASVADSVRQTADYTRRARWSSGDEIGRLVTAFNDMLAQLDRDRLVQQELAASARAAQAQRELVEAFPIPMVVTSVPDHEVLHANGPAQPWLAGCQHDPWRTGLSQAVRARFFQRLSDRDAVDEFEVHWQGGKEPSWAVLSARRLNYQGRDAVLTAFTPINVIKVMEQRLELWAKVFEASSEGILILDLEHRILSANKAFCRSTSREFYEVMGVNLSELLEGEGPLWNKVSDKDGWQGEVRIRRQFGPSYPAWLMVSAVREQGASSQVINHIGICIDITDRKAKEERIRFLAQHDVLTELPNRSLCQQRLNEALAQSRTTGEQIAVLFIDLDRFKLINDTLGHHIGDGLLRQVARRLVKAVRDTDTVSRLGGDEFVIIMRHVTDLQELDAAINERLIASIRKPMQIDGHTLSVSCSVGVAVCPRDGHTEEELMRRADAAMYEAKSGGRDMARYFSPETDQRVLARQLMETQLRQALAQGEFSLHYQPRLNARTRQLVGAEALIRWHNPVLGQVPPGDFIGLAEETGLINAIGLWVLEEACGHWVQLTAPQPGSGARPAQAERAWQLSVNLSAAQLADPLLVAEVRDVLSRSGLPAARLELEITESHLMDNPTFAQEQVAALKQLGVQVAIDDFGTGYSSLAYLKRFEIDKLKVDQSFVRGMLDDTADAAIVQAVIALGHTLGLAVVAEGVETMPTAQTLMALGCDELQGYAFSRPVPWPEFVAWAQAHASGQGTQTEGRADRRRSSTGSQPPGQQIRPGG